MQSRYQRLPARHFPDVVCGAARSAGTRGCARSDSSSLPTPTATSPRRKSRLLRPTRVPRSPEACVVAFDLLAAEDVDLHGAPTTAAGSTSRAARGHARPLAPTCATPRRRRGVVARPARPALQPGSPRPGQGPHTPHQPAVVGSVVEIPHAAKSLAFSATWSPGDGCGHRAHHTVVPRPWSPSPARSTRAHRCSRRRDSGSYRSPRVDLLQLAELGHRDHLPTLPRRQGACATR